MEVTTLVQNFLETGTEPWDGAATAEVWVSKNDAARSKENILQWILYLPNDCIRTMIAMGWDVTT